MSFFALKYMTNRPYKVIQELSMHTNQQKVFTVAAFSSPHCSNDLHQYHVSLLLHVAEVMFQDLAPHQCRDCYGFSSGTASLLK